MTDTLMNPYQTAHVTQLSDATGKKSAWKIRENKTSRDLAELPKDLTEGEVFSVLGVVRNVELGAFNVGIQYGKQLAREVFEPLLDTAKQNLDKARQENERLAAKLEQLIGEETGDGYPTIN